MKNTENTQEKKTRAKKAHVTEAPIFDLKGKKIGTEALPEKLFTEADNSTLISHYVHVYLANQRSGTASTKTRSEVSATTKKMYKQKGTGRARHAAATAPIFVGGGVAGGPKPRDYSLSMNKKMKRKALAVALSMKARANSVCVLDEEALSVKAKTKQIASFLEVSGMADTSVLFVLPEMSKNGFVLSARNIPGVDFVQSTTINPYAVLKHSSVVFVASALKKLEEHFQKTQ